MAGAASANEPEAGSEKENWQKVERQFTAYEVTAPGRNV